MAPPPAPAGDQPDDGRAGASTARGEETRQRIVDAALRLFEERGYERTTMRAVAQEAGVSLGNAYYYFSSKDHLVQAYYERMQALHLAEATTRLRGPTSLAARWTACEEGFVDVARPYHPFAGKFFVAAAQPTSPLSPFSEDSRPAREDSTRLMRLVVQGSDVKGDPRLLTELPDLLWLAHMGIILFWVHDPSPGQRRTRVLVRRTAPLLERLVHLSRLRPLRGTVHELLDVVSTLQRPGGLDDLPEREPDPPQQPRG